MAKLSSVASETWAVLLAHMRLIVVKLTPDCRESSLCVMASGLYCSSSWVKRKRAGMGDRVSMDNNLGARLLYSNRYIGSC